MANTIRLRNSGGRWAVRLIPCFIVAAITFATYVVVGHICIDYLNSQRRESGVAAALLVLYFLCLIFSAATYLRTIYTVQTNPAIVPLPHGRDTGSHDIPKRSRRNPDPEAPAWGSWNPPDNNPDSPGLEQFYSKSVFVCQADGRPNWCSECRHWKPDRAHHSSDLGRCIRKLDHVCPWVGGMVSETSFNFFVQFTFYCTGLCIVTLSAGAYCLSLQRRNGESVDGLVVAVIALSGFFGFFTLAMTLTSGRYIFTNITNIDMLKGSQKYQLAIRIPRNSPPTDRYHTIVYPLARSQGNGATPNVSSPHDSMSSGSVRDKEAIHTFAIVQTELGENPWDLGYWRNWKSVMGNNIVEWLLPIKHSPCCNHESMQSDYEYGPLIAELKRRFGLPGEQQTGAETGIEMQHRRPSHRQYAS